MYWFTLLMMLISVKFWDYTGLSQKVSLSAESFHVSIIFVALVKLLVWLGARFPFCRLLFSKQDCAVASSAGRMRTWGWKHQHTPQAAARGREWRLNWRHSSSCHGWNFTAKVSCFSFCSFDPLRDQVSGENQPGQATEGWNYSMWSSRADSTRDRFQAAAGPYSTKARGRDWQRATSAALIVIDTDV